MFDNIKYQKTEIWSAIAAYCAPLWLLQIYGENVHIEFAGDVMEGGDDAHNPVCRSDGGVTNLSNCLQNEWDMIILNAMILCPINWTPLYDS